MLSRLELQPKTKQTVAEVLNLLGLPEPSSNYDWCFGKASGANVMFQWFDQIEEVDGKIQFVETSERWASQNVGVAETVQLNRAWSVHNLVLTAYVTKRPIHVAIVDGTSKLSPVGAPAKGQFKETGQAKFRVLDDALWWPHHRDPATGQIIVVRGIPQAADFDPLSDLTVTSESEDGSTANDDVSGPAHRETKTKIFDRDTGVVRAAKARAETGRCEYCEELGFETAPNQYYLEAHHVIPLSNNGPDVVWNVAVLCANDHRRAHFGKDRDEVRTRLIEMLGKHYPADRARLSALAEKIQD